jgi:hypothetical protein
MHPDKNAKSQFVTSMLHPLYAKPKAAIRAEVVRLVGANRLLQGGGANYFFFKGQPFMVNRGGPYISAPLHRTLWTDVRKHTAEEAELEKEISIVKGYLQRALMTIESYEDFFEVIPEALHGTLRMNEYLFTGMERDLSEGVIAEFKNVNDKYLNVMKSRMTINLITSL